MKIIIIGVGEIGFNLARILSQENHDIVIIETDHDKCTHALEQLDVSVLEGNGASGEMLDKAGIEDSDIVIAASNIDEVNIMACMLAKQLSKARTVARVRNLEYSGENTVIRANQLGIDLMIHPEKEIANEIVRLAKQASATECMAFAKGKLQLLGLRITNRQAAAVGKTLLELGVGYTDIPFRVVAIVRQNDIIIPKGDDWIHFNDQLYVISDTDTVPKVLELTGKDNEQLEDVMLLGGGKIGRFVAESLEDEVGVKLVESVKEKSIRIAEQLKKTLVISGDGTDLDLLAREGIMDMDTYIALTNDDEKNIISCLLAKHLGVKRVIALVNKLIYLPILPTIGIDASVSKVLSTVDAILRFVRKGKVMSVSTFKGVVAEVIEYVVPEGAKITKKDLLHVKFPESAIVGGIIRGEKVIIPTGETRIEHEDKAIVFALPDALNEVEKLFG